MDLGPIKCDCNHCNCPSATTTGTCYECEAGLHVTSWINGEPQRAEILHQVGLFGGPEKRLGSTPYPDNRPGWTDDETGKAAALFVNQDLIHRHWEAMCWLEQIGPCCVDRIAAKMGCSHNHIAPRITELKNAGLVVDTGGRELTRSNCMAKMWALTEPAKAYMKAVREGKEKGPSRSG